MEMTDRQYQMRCWDSEEPLPWVGDWRYDDTWKDPDDPLQTMRDLEASMRELIETEGVLTRCETDEKWTGDEEEIKLSVGNFSFTQRELTHLLPTVICWLTREDPNNLHNVYTSSFEQLSCAIAELATHAFSTRAFALRKPSISWAYIPIFLGVLLVDRHEMTGMVELSNGYLYLLPPGWWEYRESRRFERGDSPSIRRECLGLDNTGVYGRLATEGSPSTVPIVPDIQLCARDGTIPDEEHVHFSPSLLTALEHEEDVYEIICKQHAEDEQTYTYDYNSNEICFWFRQKLQSLQATPSDLETLRAAGLHEELTGDALFDSLYRPRMYVRRMQDFCSKVHTASLPPPSPPSRKRKRVGTPRKVSEADEDEEGEHDE